MIAVKLLHGLYQSSGFQEKMHETFKFYASSLESHCFDKVHDKVHDQILKYLIIVFCSFWWILKTPF